MPNLKQKTVTIVCVTGVNPLGALRSLLISAMRFNSAQVLFINVWFPNFSLGKYRFERPINSTLNSIEEYGKYVQFKLWRHIQTDFVLIVQADGWVLNGKKWEDSFLEYDYIGAPWPILSTAYIDPHGVHQRVGNGGFSLRSLKLLKVAEERQVIWDVTEFSHFYHFNARPLAEDGNICIHNRSVYEASGCVFAPLEVAARFSRELPITEYPNPETFGFHCYHPKLLYTRKLKSALKMIWNGVSTK